MNYNEWIKQLDHITFMELGLETADLPDVPLMDAFNDGLTPDDAFEIFIIDYWQEYDPEAPAEMLNIFRHVINDEPEYSDADNGL